MSYDILEKTWLQQCNSSNNSYCTLVDDICQLKKHGSH